MEKILGYLISYDFLRIFDLALSLSLLATAFVYLLISDGNETHSGSKYAHYIARCCIFFTLTFLGLLAFLMGSSISGRDILQFFEHLAQSNASGSLLNFTVIPFILTIATGVIWTAIKDTEKRAKEQIDDLKKQTAESKSAEKEIHERLENKINDLSEKAKELQNIETRIKKANELQEKMLSAASLLELKAKYYTYFYQINNSQKINPAQDPIKYPYLNLLIDFFEVDIDEAERLNYFLERFDTDETRPLIQNDNRICRYLECLAGYYQHQEPGEESLKLLRLCRQLGGSQSIAP